MSIYDLIASSGQDVGAGYLAGVKNKYALQERERQRQETEVQRARNAYVQDRAFELQRSQYDLQGRRFEQQQQQQATQAQMQFGQETLNRLSKLPPEQRQAAYMARVDEAARTVGLPQGFDPQQSWAQTEAQIPPLERKIIEDVSGRKRYETGEPVFPGVEEPEPTPLEAVKLRKETALAETAELKLQEGLDKAKAGQATADELTAIATTLLSPGGEALIPGAAAVFGPAQGVMPSIWGTTISAEAKVDQLISLLTLENIDKMTGVLSDSDIKILKSAGTILQNKRIPDEDALAAIQKLAGGLEGKPEEVSPAAEVPEEGTVITNNAGERRILRGGQWVPLG